MELSSFELYFDIITLVCGGYVLYTVIKLRQMGKLFANQILIPRGSEPGECLDEEGYIAFISPRLWVLGLVVTLLGLLCVADSKWHLSTMVFPQVEKIEFIISEGSIILSLLVLIWYMAAWMKGKKLYWL